MLTFPWINTSVPFVNRSFIISGPSAIFIRLLMLMARSVASSLVCSRLDYATQKNIGFSASKTHLPGSLLVTLFLVAPTHLVFFSIFIGSPVPIKQRIKFKVKFIKFKLAMLTHNTLSSSQPAYLHTFLCYHTPIRSLRSANTNLLSVSHVHTIFASRGFSVAAPQFTPF